MTMMVIIRFIGLFTFSYEWQPESTRGQILFDVAYSTCCLIFVCPKIDGASGLEYVHGEKTRKFSEDGCHFLAKQDHRQGCSRGFARTPLLGSKRFYIHRLTV